MKYVMENCVTEWAYTSGTAYRDPFNEVELDVVFTDPGGGEHVVPAFWAGEQTWRVRYSSPFTGLHHYRTVCSDPDNADLHGQTGTLEVGPYEGKNPLMMHGPLRMAGDQRHLKYGDGTPFFWLGDTWWMGFTKRLSWPDGFRELTADRVAKGFTLVQIDHVLPVSRGGRSSWANTVTACRRCNQRKANHTPAEAGMRLLFEPQPPSAQRIRNAAAG